MADRKLLPIIPAAISTYYCCFSTTTVMFAGHSQVQREVWLRTRMAVSKNTRDCEDWLRLGPKRPKFLFSRLSSEFVRTCTALTLPAVYKPVCVFVPGMRLSFSSPLPSNVCGREMHGDRGGWTNNRKVYFGSRREQAIHGGADRPCGGNEGGLVNQLRRCVTPNQHHP